MAGFGSYRQGNKTIISTEKGKEMIAISNENIQPGYLCHLHFYNLTGEL